MRPICILLTLITLLSTSSCYEDKGNYDYEPFRRILVKVDNTYGIKKPEVPIDYTITPEVILSDGNEDLSDVSFVWRMNTNSNQQIGDTVSTEQSVTIHVDPNDKKFTYNYYLRLYVTEQESGVTNMYPVTLKVIKPYENSWVVLHDVDNHAEIGSIEYAAGSIIVTPDALTKERMKSEVGQGALTGLSVALGRRQVSTYYASYWGGLDTSTQLYVSTTNPEESGLLNQADNFLLLASWDRIIFPDDVAGFSSEDVCFANGYQAGVMCSNGKVYQGCGYSYLMYGMFPDAEVEMAGDYYIEKVIGTPNTTLAYDSKNHRFLIGEVQNNFWSGSSSHAPSNAIRGNLQTISNSPQNAANPGAINPNQKFVDFTGGYWYAKTATAAWQRMGINAYLLNEETGKSYVYVFHSYPLTSINDPEDNVPLTNMFTIDTPNGVTTNTPMTSSWDYNNILFYAVDNRIYKLDFAMTGGNSTLIYQHPALSARITCLQMAFEEYTYLSKDGTDEYGHPYARTIAAGINLENGSGEVVVLQLNTAGKVDKDAMYPAIQRHEGFGKIKDVTFI